MLELKPIFNALRRSKAGAFMLFVQIALTTAIVSNASFIIYDRVQYLGQETGYPEQDLFRIGVLTYGTDIDLTQKFEANETLIRNLPGVANAALFNHVPLSGSGSASGFGIAPAKERGKSVRAAYFLTDEFGLDTLGLEVSEGRNFRADEIILSNTQERSASVAIVSKNFLNEIFPEGDGLGKTIFFGDSPLQIIGVVDRMMGPWLKDSAAENAVIMPNVQASANQKIIIRSQPGQRDALMRDIEDVMLDDYNKRVIFGIQAVDVAKAEYNAGDLLMLRMLIVLIVVLLLVTALGIFGLTVFNINKRTKQIGTRRALGARKSDIVRYFLLENTMISLVGVIFGAIGALFLGDLLLKEYSLPSLDNTYVLGTAIFVMVVSLLSVVFPATRAANISPSIATRSV